MASDFPDACSLLAHDHCILRKLEVRGRRGDYRVLSSRCAHPHSRVLVHDGVLEIPIRYYVRNFLELDSIDANLSNKSLEREFERQRISVRSYFVRLFQLSVVKPIGFRVADEIIRVCYRLGEAEGRIYRVQLCLKRAAPYLNRLRGW